MKTYQPFQPFQHKLPALESSPFAVVLTDDDLDAETKKRRKGLQFPLHVFPQAIQPLIAGLVGDLKGERSFIGLTLLQAGSIAIGSALRASTGSWEVGLSMWGASVGISSSGKSMVQGVLMKPFYKMQEKFDQEYYEGLEAKGKAGEDDDSDLTSSPADYVPMKVVIVQDITFEALVKDVFGHNFKGIARYEDELVKWLDDMERYKSGASEASFWTGGWSPTTSFRLQRTGGKLTIVNRDHWCASVIGSTQPNILYRFFEKNRLETGFVFRFLWAFAEKDQAISPNLSFRLDNALISPYNTMIKRLYEELAMDYRDDKAQVYKLSPAAIKYFQQWQDVQTRKVNDIDSIQERGVQAGLLGKIKEYALRMSLIIKMMHAAFTEPNLRKAGWVEEDDVAKALLCCDYFLQSGFEAYQTAKQKMIVPPQVLEFASLLRSFNYSQKDLAAHLSVSKQAINKRYKEYLEKYPGAFNAKNY
ncbi:DUF3987 domain-containing protein [Spirosoma agri]|uniref:DUF3987 domain-containing protein n=1 Tax=Spirosoma agri TaxID=1987381 RepID=A0A6M0IFN9_9BACT|nr:DUF3987 domain-containing protein [Spirosoma agri]NEU67100.1 DUF3987 domain-containing protein [Spirosoma agri]